MCVSSGGLIVSEALGADEEWSGYGYQAMRGGLQQRGLSVNLIFHAASVHTSDIPGMRVPSGGVFISETLSADNNRSSFAHRKL